MKGLMLNKKEQPSRHSQNSDSLAHSFSLNVYQLHILSRKHKSFCFNAVNIHINPNLNPRQKYIFLLHKCVKTCRIHRETENRLKFNSNGKKEKENLQTLFKFYHNSKEKICQTE